MPPRGRPPKGPQQSNSATPVQSQQQTPVFQTPIPLPTLPQQGNVQQEQSQYPEVPQQLHDHDHDHEQNQQQSAQHQHQYHHQQTPTPVQNGNDLTHTFHTSHSASSTPNMTPQTHEQALVQTNQHHDQNQNNNEPIFVPAPGSAPVPVAAEGEFVALFSSWEVLFHHVSTIAKQQGYKVVKRRSSAYRDGQAGRYDLTCDRGGSEYKNTAVLRRAHTKKTSCPWKARATRMMTLGGQWKFVVSNGHHNHPPRDPNAPPARYRKKPTQPLPELQTGVMELGQTLRAEDEVAQTFMTQLETAQDREREKNGQSIADSLQRISVAIAKLDKFEASLARIEAFGQRLYAIEMRLSQLDRLPPGHGQAQAPQPATQWHAV